MKHLARDLESLKKALLLLGSMVEEAINNSIVAITQRRSGLAEEVIKNDIEIDILELAVEDSCTKILALHQPVAGDLRFIIMALKVNSYLERMADLACNIAERAIYLSSHEEMDLPQGFLRMAETVKIMVRESLDSLVNKDPDQAKAVCRRDDEVDDINQSIFSAMVDLMTKTPSTMKRAINFISACYQLERIADLADNIGEDVIYMVDGEIIRHAHKIKQMDSD